MVLCHLSNRFFFFETRDLYHVSQVLYVHWFAKNIFTLNTFLLFLNHFCIIIFRHNTVFPFQKTDWEVAIKSINKKNLSKPHSAWKGNKNLKGMLFYSTVTY